MADCLLVIDEGTTSTRAMLLASDGTRLGSDQRDLTQFYPGPGLVEHDAEQIWSLSLECAQAMVAAAGGPGSIAAIGIANQRETVVFWSRRTGRALAPAIVWQDRRTDNACRAMREADKESLVQHRSGLLLDPYFSGSKIGWALANWPQLRDAGTDLCIGTVESWLIFRLTGGLHISDATNASRTALMNIRTGEWDEALLDLFDVPAFALPRIVDCAGNFGSTQAEHFGAPIRIAGMAGDQQAAAIGQACLSQGDTKATYGTGAFVLSNRGSEAPVSQHRLLSTIGWQLAGKRTYALEGSIFVAGSLIKWLRDELGLLASSAESESLARSIPDSGGVQLVPALAGLGAPHWHASARAAISGLSFATGRAHIVRAALEAMAHQTHDLKTAFAADGVEWQCLKVDGGMAANDWLAQDLADLLDVTVERPDFVETTALGAAMLAGLGCDMFASLEDAATMRGSVRQFDPQMSSRVRSRRLSGWASAVEAVLS